MNPLQDDRRVELKLFGIQADTDLSQVSDVTHRIEHRDGTIGIVFGLSIEARTVWSDAVRELIDRLGGEARVMALMDALAPSRRTIAIYFPCNSPYQENNGWDRHGLDLMARLRVELDVNLVDFDPSNVSHFDNSYGAETVR